MPRWARLCSCSFTGLVVSLVSFVGAAFWWEGGPGAWQAFLDFLPTRAFWYLAALFGLLTLFMLVLGRLMVRLSGTSSISAGLIGGIVTAIAYASFLYATHAQNWGGATVGLYRLWPSVLVFVLPFAFSGAVTGWLWGRLD